MDHVSENLSTVGFFSFLTRIFEGCWAFKRVWFLQGKVHCIKLNPKTHQSTGKIWKYRLPFLFASELWGNAGLAAAIPAHARCYPAVRSLEIFANLTEVCRWKDVRLFSREMPDLTHIHISNGGDFCALQSVFCWCCLQQWLISLMQTDLSILFHPLPLPFREEFWLRIKEITPNSPCVCCYFLWLVNGHLFTSALQGLAGCGLWNWRCAQQSLWRKQELCVCAWAEAAVACGALSLCILVPRPGTGGLGRNVPGGAAAQPLLAGFLCFLPQGAAAGQGCWTEQCRKHQMQWLGKEWLFLTFEKWWVCLCAWKQGFGWKWSESGPLCLERGLGVCNMGDCGVRGGLWGLFWLYSSIW